MFIASAAALAALAHVYIFESLRFVTPSTMKALGIRSTDEAQIMKPWATAARRGALPFRDSSRC